jgi:diguanylate cyclase
LLGADPQILPALLEAFSDGHVGLCVTDPDDYVRFANPVFRDAFIPDAAPDRPVEFVDGLAASIRAGRGIKLESLALDDFMTRVRQKRRNASRRYDFAVDVSDGRWFWVNDHKLANGWMLIVATEITGIKSEESRLKRDHANALEAARTDFLTGLPNRRRGFEQAEAAVSLARDTGAPLALAMLDIDHFKLINDKYGHEIGDRVLIHFAQLAGERLGPRDLMSRVGGEEFLLTLPDATSWQAVTLVDRLLDMRGSTGHAAPVPYTVSAGVAEVPAGASLQDVLYRADAALYRAKAQGRARVELSAH